MIHSNRLKSSRLFRSNAFSGRPIQEISLMSGCQFVSKRRTRIEISEMIDFSGFLDFGAMPISPSQNRFALSITTSPACAHFTFSDRQHGQSITSLDWVEHDS
jgi:hypothetical protein